MTSTGERAGLHWSDCAVNGGPALSAGPCNCGGKVGPRVLVCGGREYADWRTVSDLLWSIHHDTRISAIIHGGAHGADAMAGLWAEKNGVPCSIYKPDWKAHGKSAGPIRNRQMIQDGQPDFVIAFPGGRGTADMVRQAKAAGLSVNEI